MIYPGLRELIFSLKAFAAAMLSFWINCALDLPRPTWALFLVYVLMQPLSGAVRSECVYRLIGSFAGAAIMLGIVALFVAGSILALFDVAIPIIIGRVVGLLAQAQPATLFLVKPVRLPVRRSTATQRQKACAVRSTRKRCLAVAGHGPSFFGPKSASGDHL